MCYKKGLPENETCGGKVKNSVWDISNYNGGGLYDYE